MKVKIKEKERIDDLEYKGLKIIQHQEKFCFGIDSVILSDFAKELKPGSKVLDLGTGTGILGILLCGKTDLDHIIGVEIQEDMCEMAERSILLNNLQERFSILHEDIKNLDKTLEAESFDAIVTNPPYKKEKTGIENENGAKLIARHEIACNLTDILRVSARLLQAGGSLYIVHRPERLAEIMYEMKEHHLEPKVLTFVLPKENKKPNIVLIKAVKNAKPFLNVTKPLIVYQQDGSYTEEILTIYGKK